MKILFDEDEFNRTMMTVTPVMYGTMKIVTNIMAWGRGDAQMYENCKLEHWSTQLERSGTLDHALEVYFEVRFLPLPFEVPCCAALQCPREQNVIPKKLS